MRLVQILWLAGLLALSGPVGAQTRRRPATTPRRRPTTSTRSTRPGSSSSADATTVNAARLRVADRVKVLTRFLYLYARTAKELEATEALARQTGPSAQQAAATLARNKDALRANLANVRAGLDELERSFRTTPALAGYFLTLSGAAQTAADAEDRVAAGQYDAAGRGLIEVVNRLTDVLVEMQ